MFVGHGLLAFALVGTLLRRRYGARDALLAGALAAAFATIPDVDMAYAPLGVLAADATGALVLAEAFWATGNVVHRAVTHSVVVAVAVALLAAAWAAGRRPQLAGASGVAGDESPSAVPAALVGPGLCGRVAAAALALALVAAAGAVSGVLGGAVILAFSLAALGLTEGAVRHTPFGPRAVFALALVGLASHPFGDLLTGHPPALFYPFDVVVFTERLALHPDPTLHLLGAFGVELAAIWAGVLTFLRLHGVRPTVGPHATLAAAYAGSVALIPAPTLELSYPFVFSVLAVGALGVLPRLRLERVRGETSDAPLERPDAVSAVVTGLGAVTLAWFAYGAAYLFVLG